MNKQRQTYQQGCIQRKKRERGSDVWILRYRENGMLKSLTIGTVLEFRTKAEAQRSLGEVRADINNNVEVVTFGQLCDRYLKEGIPERHTTASALRSMVNYRIRPYWFQERVSDMAKNPMAVEQWIKGLMTTPRRKDETPRPLAPKSKGHTKAVFHRLFECAMRWRYLEVQRNPMSLIELHGSSKRTRKIVLVTTEQYQKLLLLLPQHCRVMVTLAMCLGLRVSEILGLRWEDVDQEGATLQVRRSVVNGHVEDTKTLASEDELPLHPDLVSVLRQWREAELPVNGWLFGNIDTGKPYHADTMRQRHLNKAAAKIGLPKLGWHAFRHTYRARLSELGLPLEVQQKLMRHASIDMTTKYGRNSMLNVTRPANAQIVEMVMKKVADKSEKGAGLDTCSLIVPSPISAGLVSC
ncbi:MAG TPA: site-specific integrase [Candidatus Acidoferrales bacterium]|nr:site-specific integrase [Candidatus Acidoferrales bacterium]